MCKKIDCIGLIADTPVTSYLSLTPSSSGSDGVTFLVTHGRTRLEKRKQEIVEICQHLTEHHLVELRIKM